MSNAQLPILHHEPMQLLDGFIGVRSGVELDDTATAGLATFVVEQLRVLDTANWNKRCLKDMLEDSKGQRTLRPS
jgi:hypothetical protein